MGDEVASDGTRLWQAAATGPELYLWPNCFRRTDVSAPVLGSGFGLVSPHAAGVLACAHKDEVRLSMDEENAGDEGTTRDVMKVS